MISGILMENKLKMDNELWIELNIQRRFLHKIIIILLKRPR